MSVPPPQSRQWLPGSWCVGQVLAWPRGAPQPHGLQGCERTPRPISYTPHPTPHIPNPAPKPAPMSPAPTEAGGEALRALELPIMKFALRRGFCPSPPAESPPREPGAVLQPPAPTSGRISPGMWRGIWAAKPPLGRDFGFSLVKVHVGGASHVCALGALPVPWGRCPRVFSPEKKGEK